MCELATQEVALIQVLLTDLKNIDTHCVLLCLLPCISEANMTGASIPPGQKLAIELLWVAHIDFISVVQSFPGIIRKTNIHLVFTPIKKTCVCTHVHFFPENQWRGQSELSEAPHWPITESLTMWSNISSQMILRSMPSALVSPHTHVFDWFCWVRSNEKNYSFHLAYLNYIWSSHKPSFEMKHVSRGAFLLCKAVDPEWMWV